MTTLWQPNKQWAGATVAVLGNAPGLSAQLAQLPEGCKVIAASRAINVYPRADMMVAIDGNGGPQDFDGLYVVGTPGDGPGLYIGMFYERVTLAPGHEIEFRNTGLLAIRVAAMMGAAKIVLAGFDAYEYERRYDYQYKGIVQAFDSLVAHLRASGTEVIDLKDTDAAAAPAA
jgi:hypothetical protein